MTQRRADASADSMFRNPFWYALQTEHGRFGIGPGLARRYPADVIPFAGLADTSREAMAALHDLLAPGETIYVAGEVADERVEGLEHGSELPGWQMHFHEQGAPSLRPGAIEVRVLGAADAPAMVALTNVAFPGFFRPRTYELGSYYGIHAGGALVAMGGERIALPGYREISALCTHPDHTGRGYAAAILEEVLRAHAVRGLASFLHVLAANQRAIDLYERLGFTKTRPMLFHRLRRR